MTGQVGTGSVGLGAFQEVDAYSLLMPVTKHSYRVLDVNRLPHAISEAWDICQNGRKGPVHIDLPIDQMNSDIDPSLLTETYGVKPVAEDLSALPEAVQWIKESKRPLILVGGGAIDASKEVMELARLLKAPVDTTLMGMGVVPCSYELFMGPLGLHGRMSALTVCTESDLIISIGSRFSDRTYSPHDRMEDPHGRIIHIDIDATEFGKHHHGSSLNLLGDSKKVLKLLLGALGGAAPSIPEWTENAKKVKSRCCCNQEWDCVPIAPQKVMQEINKVIDDDTIVTTDVGQNQMWAMHYLDIEHPRQFITSGTFGTMGFGLPSALGAKVAKPDKNVMTITGDGGLQMVIQELSTSVADDIPVTVVLLNNGTLGMVRQMQKFFWNERYSNTTIGADPDFVKVAEGFGAKGIHAEKPGEIADALKEARESSVTTVVEIMIDPDIEILPMLPANPNIAPIKGYCKF